MSSRTTAIDLRPSWMKEIADLITHLTGIQLGEQQRAMLESRLEKRIRDLGLSSSEEYLDYVRTNLQTEGGHLVSLLTTHHTFFFREFGHFEYLGKEVLPNLIPKLKAIGRNSIRIWSAACSQGQEPYSLAMYMFQHLKQIAPGFNFEIFGTDVDPDSVSKAKNGVYRWSDVKEIPLIYLWNHWARGTGEIRDYVKAKQTLKQHCRFEVQNLMQIPEPKQGMSYDIIFCRNVFIYFTPEQIKVVTNQLLKHLSPHGYLFIGTSESLTSLRMPVTGVAPSIYMKAEAVNSSGRSAPTTRPGHLSLVSKPEGGSPTTKGAPATAPSPAAVSVPRKKIRVLCVDDSMTILILLKKILVDDFEVVGTAKNGLEAKELASKLKFDVMTLDIHMPGQSGIEYLKANMSPSHPPVVMISSVPREDSQVAFECLQLGANDYIEKPTMNDLAVRKDEILTKIRCAASVGTIQGQSSQIDRSFKTQFTIKEPSSKLRIIFCGASDSHKIATIGAELNGPQPPTVILLEGATGIIPAMADYFEKQTHKKPEILHQQLGELKNDTIYFGELGICFDQLKSKHSAKSTSFIVLGDITKDLGHKIKMWSGAHIVLEDLEVDLSINHKELIKRSHYFVPYTSMAYHSNEFLSKVTGHGK